jgi:hypothetical protein
MQTCEHLKTQSQQASAVVNGGRYCAPCASERITEMVQTVAPSAIPYYVAFNECDHQHNGSRCAICYAGTIGTLLLNWSYSKAVNHEHSRPHANRLAAAIRALVKHYGAVVLGVIGPDQFE